MDAALWNSRWTESFPDADPPPWPQEDDGVESAVAASQDRLESLQQQAKREVFHLMCLRSHVQTIQSVGWSTPTADGNVAQALVGAFSESSNFKRHTVCPTPVRSRSAADILDRSDIYSPPLKSTPSSRRLNRGRNLGPDRLRRRRLSRPSDVSSDDEQAQDSSPSKFSLSEGRSMSTSTTKSGDDDVVDDVTAETTTTAAAAPRDGREQVRERLRHLRRQVDGDARKMILGLRRARVADGSILPSTPTLGPPAAIVLRDFDTSMSPTEKYLPPNLYPMSLTQVGDALNHSAISRLSSTESTSSDGTPICDEDNDDDVDDDDDDQQEYSDTDGPSPTDTTGISADQRGTASPGADILRSPSPSPQVDAAHTAGLTSNPAPIMAHHLRASDRITGGACGDDSADDIDDSADGMDVMLRAMEAVTSTDEWKEEQAAVSRAASTTVADVAARNDTSEESSSSETPAQQEPPTQPEPSVQPESPTPPVQPESPTPPVQPESPPPVQPESPTQPELESAAQPEPSTEKLSSGPKESPSVRNDDSVGASLASAPGQQEDIMDMLLRASDESKLSVGSLSTGSLPEDADLDRPVMGSQSTLQGEGATVPSMTSGYCTHTGDPASPSAPDAHRTHTASSQSVFEAVEGTPPSECKTPSEATPSGDAECSADAVNRHDVASPTRAAGDPNNRLRTDSISEEFSESYMRPEQAPSTSSTSTITSELPSPHAVTSCRKAMTRSSTTGTVYESIDSLPAATPPSSVGAAVPTSAAKNPLYERLDNMDELIQRSISHSGLVAATSSSKLASHSQSFSSISQGRSEYSSGSEDNLSRDIPSVASGEEIPSMSLEEELIELRRPSVSPQTGVPPSQSLKSFNSMELTSSVTSPPALASSPLPSLQAQTSSPMVMLTSLEASLVQKKAAETDGPTNDEESFLMRKMVVMGIVDSEKLYLEVLQILINNYYKPLSAVATSSQPIISQRDCDLIFHNLCAIVEVHESLNKVMEPLLSEWHTRTEVGAVLEDLVRQLPVYKSYLDNYPRAIDIVTRYRQESGAFSAFLKAAASIKGLKKNVPFEELLQMPVQRLQNYTLVMHDLVRYTPESHPDYKCLSASVADLGSFLSAFNTARAAGGSETQCGRRLVKHALCVEALSDGRRKFRHLFLYEDALLCCTAPYRNRQKEKHECKWYSPLSEVGVNPAYDGDDNMHPLAVSQADLNALSLKVNKYRGELKQINRAMADTRKRAKKASDREKIRKRLLDSEMHLKQMLACSLVRFAHKGNKYKHITRYLPGNRLSTASLPQVSLAAQQPSVTSHVPLKDSDHHHKKPYYILFFGDLEAKEFEDAVMRASHEGPHMELTQFELQDMMAKSKLEMDLLDAEAAAQEEDDENENIELLDGLMTVYIEGALGLKPTLLDVICIMELDTYGHFERKAKTRAQSNNGSPQFEQGFEIELEATQALVITIVEKGLKVKGRQLGKVTLDLLPYCEEGLYAVDVPIQPQGTLALRMQYFTPEEAARRVEILKAHTSTSVFGQSIDIVSLREGDLVPAIVRICCEQVETRGLEETGIYRISGLLSDVRNLKQAFDNSTEQASALAQEVDVHAVSGCLKLYFREMPDPIFPRAMYTKFVEGLSLSNPQARQSCLLSLLYSIPDPNLMTALYLIKHLKIVSANSGENKMPNQNLSTVFGPNLFKPESRSEEEDLSAALDVVSQVGVFVFFLDLTLDTLLIEAKMPVNKPHQEPPTTFVKGHRRGPSNTSNSTLATAGGSSPAASNSSPAHGRKFFRKA